MRRADFNCDVSQLKLKFEQARREAEESQPYAPEWQINWVNLQRASYKRSKYGDLRLELTIDNTPIELPPMVYVRPFEKGFVNLGRKFPYILPPAIYKDMLGVHYRPGWTNDSRVHKLMKLFLIDYREALMLGKAWPVNQELKIPEASVSILEQPECSSIDFISNSLGEKVAIILPIGAYERLLAREE